jgi:hypothetical protein
MSFTALTLRQLAFDGAVCTVHRLSAPFPAPPITCVVVVAGRSGTDAVHDATIRALTIGAAKVPRSERIKT